MTTLHRTLSTKPASPLRHRGFALYWTARMVSLIGDQVFTVAFAPLVLELSHSNSELGRLFATFSLCQVAFLVLGGIVSDRFARRRIMIATDLTQAATLGLTMMLLWQGRLEVWHLYLLAALFGTASAFFMPASSSLLPEVLPKALLVPANALAGLGMQAIGVLGPALGGLLVALGGARLSFTANAASFVVSALCVLSLRTLPRTEPAPSSAPKSSPWHDLLEGYAIVRRLPWLWITIAIFAVVNVFDTGIRLVLLPALARERFGGPAALGWMLSSLSAGAVLTALVLARLPRLRRRGLLGYGSFIVVGLGFVLIAISHSLPLTLGLAFVVGAGHMTFGVIWPVTVQELVPTEAQGRVWSLDMIGSFALLPLGYLFSGWFSSAIGTGATIAVYGAAVIAFMLLGLSAKSVRELE